MPEGLEKIGWGCFKGSGLEEIIIPKSVKKIEWIAFSQCKNLQRVVFQEGSELREL